MNLCISLVCEILMNLLIKTTKCIQQEQALHQDKHHMNNKQLTSKVILSHHNSLQVFVGSEFSNSDLLNYKSWDVTDSMGSFCLTYLASNISSGGPS